MAKCFVQGGISYFATKEAFVCDNVVSYEVVLANGTVINVTSSSHGDLWLALKGGGNNFAIVTSFTFRTFQQGDIWGGTIYYPLTTVTQQLQAFNAFSSAANFDVNAGLIQSFGYSGGEGALILNQIAYALPEVNPPAYQPFTSIEPQLESTTAITNLAALSVAEDALSPPNLQ